MTEQSQVPTIIEIYAAEQNITRDDLVSLVVNHLSPKGKDGRPLATKADVIMFLQIARRFGLDPWASEIYLIPSQRGVKTYVSIDGYSKIVTRHPDFDGMTFDYEWADNRPISCTCTIYRKSHSRGTSIIEYYDEVARDTQPWRQAPARMLRHKAFMQAARMVFGVSGALGEEDDGPAVEPAIRDVSPQPEERVMKPLSQKTESVIPSRRPPPAPERRNGAPEKKAEVVEAKAEPVVEEKPIDLEAMLDSLTATLKAAKTEQDVTIAWENVDAGAVFESDEDAVSLARQLWAKALKRVTAKPGGA